jgi:hypothetical protein
MYARPAKVYEAHPINVPVHLFIAQDDHTDEPPLDWGKVLPAAQ